MKIINGIEGDYIETKNDNLIFDTKGLLHPNDRKISFLRFYPHPDGERVKDNTNFKKVYRLNERYALLKEKYPKYLFFSNELDLEVQAVKNQDIRKIYTPRNFIKELSEQDKLSNSVKCSKSLYELFIMMGDISINSIGITGSIMIGLNTENSDIDLVIYGTETSMGFQEKLVKIFKKSNSCRKYNLNEYKIHYNWRVAGSNILFEDFLKSEQRKLHQGKFMNRDFFIRYIKSPKDWKGNFYDYQYKNLGRIKLKAEITDSKDSIFTPCSYKIRAIKTLQNNLISSNLKIKEINEINSFRGRFCEQARDGETVLVEGKLEGVRYKKKSEYFRILLTDPAQDKMIII